jgi:DNA-binding CsgD family transcriptional regulator
MKIQIGFSVAIGKHIAAYIERRDAKQARVARLYQEGGTVQQLSKGFRLRAKNVLEILVAHNVAIRRQTRVIRAGERADDAELIAQVAELYKCHTLHQVANNLHMTVGAVRRLLDQAGIERRRGPRTRVLLITETRRILNEEEVIRAYEEGGTAEEVGRMLGIAHSTVRRVLKRHGIPGRRRGRKIGPPSQRNLEIAAIYQSGKTLQQTGAQFGVTRERVRQIIGRVGVPSRPAGPGNSPLTSERREEAVRLYRKGKSRAAVAAMLRMGPKTVRQILDAEGVAHHKCGRRSRPEQRRRQKAMVQMYQRGETLTAVARAFHASVAWVRKVLINHGVKARGKRRGDEK